MVNTGSKVHAAAGSKPLVIDPGQRRRHEKQSTCRVPLRASCWAKTA
ncbi:MAG: hypothetical protein ACLR8Y_01775 [Alistipes indistinctus]